MWHTQQMSWTGCDVRSPRCELRLVWCDLTGNRNQTTRLNCQNLHLTEGVADAVKVRTQLPMQSLAFAHCLLGRFNLNRFCYVTKGYGALRLSQIDSLRSSITLASSSLRSSVARVIKIYRKIWIKTNKSNRTDTVIPNTLPIFQIKK
jgi:hypothetical protein